MEHSIISVPLVRGSGWAPRPLPASEAWAHYPGAADPPGPDATYEEDLAYFRYLEEIGYQRFKDADLSEEGIDEWPGPPGAGISYSLCFAQSGRIFRGHDPARQSSHTKGHNYAGMGYCFWIAEGDTPTPEQVAAAAWALNEQVRLGELLKAEITGGHREVFATICPTDTVMAQIPLINAAAGGQTMARRRPTSTDVRNRTRELMGRRFTITCGPFHYDDGRCRPGKHGHSADSRHWLGLAIDVSKDPREGVPISDYERAHLDLLLLETEADTEIDWRSRWRDTAAQGGLHHDHYHMDDRPDWFESKNLSGVLARDGVDIFIDHVSFPWHKPQLNEGFSIGYIATKIQPGLKALGRYSGVLDGYKGTGTTAAIRALQDEWGIEVDGLPGDDFLKHLALALAPTPQPTPTPGPEPEPEPDLLSGFTVEHWKRVQAILARLLDPHTGQPYLTDPDGDPVDGDPGPVTRAALAEMQRDYGLAQDALPGDKTMPVLEAAWLAQKRRLAGPDAYSTAVAVAEGTLPAGRVVILAARDTPDLDAATQAAMQHGEGSRALPVPRRGDLPAAVRAHLERTTPKVVIVGGPASIPVKTAADAILAAGN